jgi:hypothetical protein
MFLEYDGTGNRFDWILEEARKLREERQQFITRGLMIKNLARSEEMLRWREIDKEAEIESHTRGGRPWGSKNKPKNGS